MLFKDCKFKNKASVRKVMKESILQNIKTEVPFSICNVGRILEYLDLLIDESKYNIKGDYFYYQYKKVRITFDIELFSKVAAEYINENLDDFLLMKHN